MNRLVLLIITALLISCSTKTEIKKEDKKIYNSTLAKKLGADEYGMKAYVMAFLKKGPNRSQDSTERNKL